MVKKNLLEMTPKSPMAKAKRLIELQTLLKEIKPEIESLKADLLQVTQDLGVLTLRTEGYTISRVHRITPQVVDFQSLRKCLDNFDIPYETEEVFTPQTMVMFKQAIDEGKELAGLEGKITEYISVRIIEDKGGEHGK